jgi:Protein of unknown function (DUF4031)
MTARIGVARKWYQGDHYDIALSKRAIAVEHGAVEITLRQLAAMSRRQKVTGTLGTPNEAEAWAVAYYEEFRRRRRSEGQKPIVITGSGEITP